MRWPTVRHGGFLLIIVMAMATARALAADQNPSPSPHSYLVGQAPWMWSSIGPQMPAAVAAPPPGSRPNWIWSGFYGGVHFGGAWNHRDATIFQESTGIPRASGSTNSSGPVGGAQAGFNYAVTPNWITGIEADASATNLRDKKVGSDVYGERDSNIDGFGTVRGRVGYVWNGVLGYATAGFAWADERLVRTQQFGIVNNAPPGTRESAAATGLGWTAGAGIEWCFDTRWTARLEYLHLGLDSQSFVFPLAGQRIDATARIDVARFGVNYKFE